MLYMSEYGFTEDPNDYSIVKPYDYDAVSGETVILSGGTYSLIGDKDYPATSDKGVNEFVLPIIMLCVSLIIATLVLGKKKERRSL